MKKTLSEKGLKNVFKKLLAFDNEIIRREFIIKEKNLMIWPLIRWEILHYIRDKKLRLNITPPGRSIFSLNSIGYLYKTIRYAPHRLDKKYDIIFYNVTARGRLNNKNFNIYVDYYSSLHPKALVIDKSFNMDYYIPENKDDFATGEYGEVKAFLFYQIKRFISKKNPNIENFIKFLKTKDIISEYFVEKIIKKILYYYYFGFDYHRSYIQDIFKKLNPKIIFVHGAALGGRNSTVLKIAKENRIITGEFQHGVISKSHMAYNYGDAIFKSDTFKKYLPDFILTYGDYWNEQIRIPSKKVTIGNPHFYEMIKRYNNIIEQKNSILIVSQSTMADKFFKIAKFLSGELKNYNILLKLQPGQKFFKENHKEINKYSNLKVTNSGDIYKYLAKYENIVACYSTTIFEALGFNKKLFILDNAISREYIPLNIGLRFKENDELKELIINVKKQEKNYDLEYYFSSNWKKNYKSFLTNYVGIR